MGFLWKNPLNCLACKVSLGSIDWLLDQKLTVKVAEFVAIQFCASGMEKIEVCRGAVREMSEVVVP